MSSLKYVMELELEVRFEIASAMPRLPPPVILNGTITFPAPSPGPPSFRPNGGPRLRDYQHKIVGEVLGQSAIVRLPTGAGKTLIAAEVLARVGGRALFLVPTVSLVEQQALAVQEWLTGGGSGRRGPVVARLHGEISHQLPNSFDVLVSTPAAFAAAQAKQGRTARSGSLQWESLQWESFRLVIIDEVHHVLKEHPYRKLALALAFAKTAAPRAAMPQVLGLSASLTYEVERTAMEEQVLSLCKELGVTRISSASSAELERGGYRAESRFKVKVLPRLNHEPQTPNP